MKKTLITFALILATATVWAIPAKRGIWKTITLADGTTVKVELRGDEHANWLQAADGKIYIPTATDDIYQEVNKETIMTRAKARKVQSETIRRSRLNAMKRVGGFFGMKKALVILVEFADKSFRESNDLARYKRIINEVGFKDGSFYGSVRDYFLAQSSGQFDLNFDVVGPYRLNNNYSYYGGNSTNGDRRPGAMIAEALISADEDVDFSLYDWDGDGEVEQVYIVYAGQGEADGGSANTVWPHAWALSASDYGQTLTLDNVTLDTYACGNEINGYNQTTGIGTMCHEFSHCMGFPDFYDTSSNGNNFGMGDWDLMCSGSYNGNGYQPAGYTSYERMVCGWIEPKVLENDTIVSNMQPLSEGGEAFIIYNKAYPDEYVMLENRAKTNWDSSLPGEGMLALYVDYDELIWEYNYPNAYVAYQGLPSNTYERMTIFPANNYKSNYYQSGNPYPYNNNDSLTNTSRPALKLNHANTDGKKLLNVGILNIRLSSDNVVSFNFRGAKETIVIDDERPENAIFYESFDQCAGTGGNDDVWSGATTASASFLPDMTGWSYVNAAGANKCAKFGSGSKSGEVTTPQFTVEGEADFSFRAAPWGADDTALTLSISGDATIEPSELTMTSQQWTEFKTKIVGNGPVTITFTPAKRFFLDHVAAVSQENVGINETIYGKTDYMPAAIYSIDGRYLGTNFDALGRGIYIVNGKKIVK